MKYIIFGAGAFGEPAMRNLGIPRIKCFVDNDPEKKMYFDKEVISFEALRNMDLSDIIVVIASEKYWMEMEKQLLTIPNIKYFIFRFDFDSCELPHYYLNRQYESVTYNRILSLYDLKKYNKIAIIGNNERLPYLISEISIQSDYKKIKEVIMTDSEIITQSVGINCVDWEDSDKDFDCVIINLPRNYPGLDDILEQIEDKTDIIDLYDADRVEKVFEHPELVKYKDMHKGKRCFIVGTGPSLRIDDLNVLYEHNEICISVNKIYRCYDKTKWRANYVGLSDPKIVADMIVDKKRGVELPKKMFVGDNNIHHEYNYNEFINDCEYFHLSMEIFEPNKPRFTEDMSIGSYWGWTITYDFALPMAAYMGFSEIYLLGLDHSMTGKISDKQNHFIENYYLENEKDESHFGPSNWEAAAKAYEAAEKYSRKHGFRIFNATRGGKLEVFERVDFDSLW